VTRPDGPGDTHTTLCDGPASPGPLGCAYTRPRRATWPPRPTSLPAGRATVSDLHRLHLRGGGHGGSKGGGEAGNGEIGGEVGGEDEGGAGRGGGQGYQSV
jgi:hypothetical protein